MVDGEHEDEGRGLKHRYVECPQETRDWIISSDRVSVFLAGGITGCPDWQGDMRATLHGLPLTVVNPRRPTFDVSDPAATEEQIAWEHRHLRRTDVVLFWFPKESVCPIALYELGVHGGDRRAVVGVHPEYPRRRDVEIQQRLRKHVNPLAYSLRELKALLLSHLRADYGAILADRWGPDWEKQE